MRKIYVYIISLLTIVVAALFAVVHTTSYTGDSLLMENVKALGMNNNSCPPDFECRDGICVYVGDGIGPLIFILCEEDSGGNPYKTPYVISRSESVIVGPDALGHYYMTYTVTYGCLYGGNSYCKHGMTQTFTLTI